MSLPTRPDGSPALPVSIVTSTLTEGGVAIPVYGYTSAQSRVIGSPALQVKVLSDSDLIQNGGKWRLEGRPYAMPVYTAPTGMVVQDGPPIAVYAVNPSVWPPSGFSPSDIAGLRWDIDFVDITRLFQNTALTTPVTTNGQYIQGIADKSGLANNPTQSFDYRSPEYRASGFGSNSVGYGYFNGDASLGLSSRIKTNTNPVYGETEWTVYLVYRSRETGTSNFSPILHGESNNVEGFNIYDFHETLFSGNDDSVGIMGGNGGANYFRSSLTNSVPPNTEVIATVTWKDGQNPPVAMRVNGVSQSPLGGNGSGAFSIVWDSPDFGLSISPEPVSYYLANTAAKIDVARILIYQGQHTSAEWGQIEPYLASYCGISI